MTSSDLQRLLMDMNVVFSFVDPQQANHISDKNKLLLTYLKLRKGNVTEWALPEEEKAYFFALRKIDFIPEHSLYGWLPTFESWSLSSLMALRAFPFYRLGVSENMGEDSFRGEFGNALDFMSSEVQGMMFQFLADQNDWRNLKEVQILRKIKERLQFWHRLETALSREDEEVRNTVRFILLYLMSWPTVYENLERPQRVNFYEDTTLYVGENAFDHTVLPLSHIKFSRIFENQEVFEMVYQDICKLLCSAFNEKITKSILPVTQVPLLPFEETSIAYALYWFTYFVREYK